MDMKHTVRLVATGIALAGATVLTAAQRGRLFAALQA